MTFDEAVPLEEYRGQQELLLLAKSTVSGTAIMSMQFPKLRWAVCGFVPEGLSILAGRQKLGKTWLAFDWAIAVAKGGHAMGSVQCEHGEVLYIDLENGYRRIQGRMRALGIGPNAELLQHIQFMVRAPRLDKGLIEILQRWRASTTNPRLVIIDVFQRVRPEIGRQANLYAADYDALSPLQSWATQHGIAVVLIHHTRKGGADDPLEALSGTNGLSACADTTLVLDRDAGGYTLYVRGRDVEERKVAVAFEDGHWRILGEAADIRRSDERSRILDVLSDADGPMSPSEISDVLGVEKNNVQQLLFQMGKTGEVTKNGRGAYVHPDRVDEFSS
jgi:RecA-family ATPase